MFDKLVYMREYRKKNDLKIKTYLATYRQNNRSGANEYAANYRSAHKKKIAENGISYYRNIHKTRLLRRRVEAQLVLGGKCARCGFGDDYRVLQIDHINGGGSIARRSRGSKAALRDVLNGSTKDYQLLCANCNVIKRHEMGEN